MHAMVRQGDILLIRLSTKVDTDGLSVIPREGDGAVVLAHGEVTGHRHRFHGAKTEMVAPWPVTAKLPQERTEHARKLLASLKEIPSGAELIGIVSLRERDDLIHEEHATIPHEAGQYAAIRQRSYTPARIEIVAD